MKEMALFCMSYVFRYYPVANHYGLKSKFDSFHLNISSFNFLYRIMSSILELFLVYERTDFNNNEDFGLIAYYVEKIIINTHLKCYMI